MSTTIGIGKRVIGFKYSREVNRTAVRNRLADARSYMFVVYLHFRRRFASDHFFSSVSELYFVVVIQFETVEEYDALLFDGYFEKHILPRNYCPRAFLLTCCKQQKQQQQQ